MIEDIQKILNVSETKLRYRKRETMEGLYFKEMLSKIKSSKNKQDNHKDSRNENEHKENEHTEAEHKEDIIPGPNKQPEGEGTFLDKLC